MEDKELSQEEIKAKEAKLELATTMGIKMLQEYLKTEKGVEFTEEQTAEFRKRYQAAFMLGLMIL